jgi:hypothetical protein
MARRWYICPVLTIIVIDDESAKATGLVYRASKAHRSVLGYRKYSSSVGSGNWCLTLINARDFTAIDNDPDCRLIFELPRGQHPAIHLRKRLSDLNLDSTEQTGIKMRMQEADVDIRGLHDGLRVEDWLERIRLRMDGNAIRGIFA